MKKTNLIKIFIVVMLLLCAVTILFACVKVDNDPTDNPNVNNPDGNVSQGITMTFKDGDDVVHISKDVEEVLNYEPEAKEGYEFAGWYSDKELTKKVTKIPTSNTTLYAKWEIKTFSVRFINHDGSIIPVNGNDVQKVAYGEAAVAPETPVREGHEFKGWSVDFSKVKTDLVVRANFGTATQNIVVYGEDGTVIRKEKVEVGSDISVKYNTLVDFAEQKLPGGLAFDEFCIDPELTTPYQVPSGEHVMPSTDLVLYTKAVMQEIEGLEVKPNRNNFGYDLGGFKLESKLYNNSIITYSYEWYDVTAGAVIENEKGSVLSVGCKEVGEYTYKVKVTATYKNLEPKYAEKETTVTVKPGTLEGMVSVSGLDGMEEGVYDDVYNGLTRNLAFNGYKAGDKVSYRRAGETDYKSSPIKDAGDYSIETKVERANYEPLELEAVDISIAQAELKVSVSIVAQKIGGIYILTYGGAKPAIEYEIKGFVNGETEAVLEGEAIESNPYYVGAPVGLYELGMQEDCWRSNNYKFVEWGTVELRIRKRELTVSAAPQVVTYGDEIPSYTVSLDGALESDVENIKAEAEYTCSYEKGTPAGTYTITVAYTNDSYDITINSSELTVNKKAVTVTPDSFTVIYGDDEPTYTFKADGLVNGEALSVLGTPSAICAYEKGTGTGNYTITIQKNSVGNANYDITLEQGNVKVNPKPITLRLANTGIVYYDAYPENSVFAANLSAEGLIEGDSVGSLATSAQSFTSAYAIGQPAGEYEVTVGGYSSPNYIINGNKAVKGKLIVNKRDLTISVVASSVTYGDELDIKVSYSGLVGEDKFNPENAVTGGEITGGYEVGYGVGTYTVSVGNYQSANYNTNYVDGVITVVERPLTVKARAYTDDEIVWSKSVTATDGSFAIDGLYENDVIAGTLKTVSDEARGYSYRDGKDNFDGNGEFIWDNENQFSITRGDESVIGNYVVTFDFQVAIKTYGMLVTADDVYYDGELHGLNVQQMFEDPIGFILYSVDGENYSEEALEYKTTGQYVVYYAYRVFDAEGNTKDVPSSKPATVKIKPRPVNILVDAKEITYGDADPELTYRITSYKEGQDIFAKGDSLATLGTLSLDIVAEDGEYTGNAGFYDIVASGLENDNYAVNVKNARLTVKQKNLKVTAGSFVITYGDAKPTFTATCEGFVKGESVESLGTQILFNCEFSASSSDSAGDFDITPILSLANYKVEAVKGNLKVNKKAITLTAKSLTATFGDNTPTLSATPSALAYTDTVDSIVKPDDFATEYVRGSNVGSYAIVLEVSSDKYDITIKNGTLTVNKKNAAVSWTGNGASYTYNGLDRSSAIGASYVDIYGKTITASVAFSASNSTPNAFKNAGSYKTTASTADGNYNLTNATITLNMNKARYTDITYNGSFTGVYSPDKTLVNDYALSGAGYRWKNGDTVPTVDVISYVACYNRDSENYFDYEINVSVELTPAYVSLGSSSETVNAAYDIETAIDTNSTNMNPTYTLNPTIWWIEGGRAIGAAGNYTLAYSNGSVFTPGSYLTVMTFNSVNYKLKSADGSDSNTVNYFIKYKSVLIGSTLYTPEDALKAASSGNVTVKTNTTFASQQDVADRYYNDSAYYTVKSGVTLIVPFNSAGTAFIGGGEKGGSDGNYAAHPASTNTVARYITLTIPARATLNVNGTFTVGAMTGKQGTGYNQNLISGNYSEVNVLGNVVVENGNLNVYGYAKGSGKITAKGSTTVTENMALTGWLGGSIGSARFIGNKQILATTFITSGNYTVDNPTMFPFNQYELRAVQTTMELQYGASLRGVVKIATSEQTALSMTVAKAKVNLAYLPVVSSSADANSGIIRMTTASDKVTKTFANNRVKLTLDGQIQDGYTTLGILVLAKNVVVTSEKVIFTIDGKVDIVVNSGTFTQSYKFKLLPGATLTVKNGATYNMNSTATLVTYKNGFNDTVVNDSYKYPTGRGDAKVYVEGTMNVNGSFGGDIYGLNGGKVVIGANATITAVKSIEGTGSMARSGLNVQFTFTESSQSQTRDLTLNNKSGTTAAAKGTTYTYNGTAWA